MIKKRALLIGINTYSNFNCLKGCVNDVNALFPLLSRNEDSTSNFSCRKLICEEGEVDRDLLIQELEALFAPGADVALLYFAGHGSAINNDVALVAQNGTTREPGVPISQILGMVTDSLVKEIIIILDCCFSGAAGSVPLIGGSSVILKKGLSILTASRNDQVAEETPIGRGAFSTFLCGALDGGAADTLGRVNLSGVYSYLSESFGVWGQTPTFKANVDRLHELRFCSPAVPLRDLLRITEFFSDSYSELNLDPSYEPTMEPRHAENEEIFTILQKCRAAKLVAPVGAEHMFFAASESKSCRLTPLGRHYWRLVKEELL
jgi:hypothetical protein